MSDDVAGMIRHWWTNRTDEQRSFLLRAAERDDLDDETRRVLVVTGCPIVGISAEWGRPGERECAWQWANIVRDVIFGL